MSSALQYLEQGLSLRSTETTKQNNGSSRSHAVFTLHLTSENTEGKIVTRLEGHTKRVVSGFKVEGVK